VLLTDERSSLVGLIDEVAQIVTLVFGSRGSRTC
jgi:hypothetical protein